MKQKMKKALLVLCMAVCFLALSGCSAGSGKAAPADIAGRLKTKAESYLKQFAAYDSETLKEALEEAQWQKDTVMETALTAWQSSMAELGGLVSINADGATVNCLDKHSYEVIMEAQFEKRSLTFTMTVEEEPTENGQAFTVTLGEEPEKPLAEDEKTALDGASSDLKLVTTDLLFVPYYTRGEKLSKAGMNTLMGMGTVFLVLIFISLIIGSFKNINKWEASMAAKKQAAVPAPAPVPALAPAAVAAIEPAPADMLAPSEPVWDIPLPGEEENAADDLELVAVITAAIAAATRVPVEGLVVRSIRRRPGSKWKNA